MSGFDANGRAVDLSGLADPADVRERFARRCQPSTEREGCIDWQGFIDRNGYGRISAVGTNGLDKDYFAHRMAWILAGRVLPEAGMVIRHRCDRACCVSIGCLEIGTQADNARDRELRGRGGQSKRSGELSGRAVLSEAAVKEIRSTPRRRGSDTEFARKFGVTPKAVRNARNGKTWTHLNS